MRTMRDSRDVQLWTCAVAREDTSGYGLRLLTARSAGFIGEPSSVTCLTQPAQFQYQAFNVAPVSASAARWCRRFPTVAAPARWGGIRIGQSIANFGFIHTGSFSRV